MKKILFVFLAALPLMVSAQGDVISEVCGVAFGTDYEKVKTSMTEAFGKKPAVDWGNNCIIYRDADIRHKGLTFSALTLWFAERKTETEVSLPVTSVTYTLSGNDTIARDTTITSEKLTIPRAEHLLNSAVFIFLCKTEAEASLRKAQIELAMKKEYQLTERNGRLYGGISPLNSNRFGFSIYVGSTAKIFGDEFPYSATLTYGPYGYDK